LIIHKFGWSKMSPWQFPMIWFYFLAGICKLISLLRQGAYFEVILPQDGVFTAAFAALAAKLAGIRVVCIDHGNLVSFQSQIYRTERIQSLSIKKPWFRRPLERLMFIWYWPSLFLLSHISARYVDQFLIPGVVGDGTEEICRNLGIPTSRIVRFGSMIDTSRYTPLEMVDRIRMRAKHGIATEAIVIAIICRLAPEKGLDIGLGAISRMISELSPEKRSQVHIIIAGDGPLRADIEKMIHIRGLSQNCVFWGETSTTGVISLLGMSDIFLYTSRRGACLSMAVLEAMASGCAVVASIRPLSNVQLLADGRGIAVPAENVEETSIALKKLVNDLELCRSMGRKAREYVARQHSPSMLKRVLMRATYWSELDGFLKPDAESKG
jgi:glycosyltransferase involved in cell wall biosynthesis